jgi:hypothetical protein
MPALNCEEWRALAPSRCSDRAGRGRFPGSWEIFGVNIDCGIDDGAPTCFTRTKLLLETYPSAQIVPHARKLALAADGNLGHGQDRLPHW